MLGIGPRANLVCRNAVELRLHQVQMHFWQLPKVEPLIRSKRQWSSGSHACVVRWVPSMTVTLKKVE
jgi:hypothetical protein